ncbi:MAG: TonB-dependent receptor [Pontixanthobacter sp.]
MDKIRKILLFSAVMSQPGLTLAYAQEAVGGDGSRVGEIVVTAQGRAQALQDVPVSVSVLSGETLAQDNVTNLEGVSSRVSSVKITTGGGADSLNIRGIGSGFNPGFEQAVGTFVDGIYRSRSRAARASLFDVERVEILKGPQTTFFGNNAIAGAFNITTRKPGHDLEYNASALYGSFDQYSLEAGVSVPISATLSARVAGKYYGMDGFVFNEYTEKNGPRQRNWIGRSTLVWEPTDRYKSTFRFDRGRLRAKDANPSELLHCPPEGRAAMGLCLRYLNAVGGSVDDELNLRHNNYPGTYAYDLREFAWLNELEINDNLTLAANTGYFKHRYLLENVTFPVPMKGSLGLPSSFPYTQSEKYNSFSQEVRLVSSEDRPLSFMIGVYYSYANLNFDAYDAYYQAGFLDGAAPYYSSADPVVIRYNFNQKEELVSAFGSVTYRFTDRLRLNAGLRYSIASKQIRRFIAQGVLSGPGPYPLLNNFVPGTPEGQAALNAVFGYSASDVIGSGKRTDRKLMPTASLQFEITSSAVAYASFTKGFKAGGFSAYGDNPFDPENVEAYEVGVKGHLFDRRLMFSLAGFWSDYKDLQETVWLFLPDGSIVQSIANAGKARSRGVEVGATLNITDFLRFNTDFAYTDAKYTHYPNGPCTAIQNATIPGCVQDLTGKRRPYAPKWSGSAGLGITVPVSRFTLSIDPAVRFTSRYVQQTNNDPLLFQPGNAKIDTRVSFGPSDRAWELSVIGTNLTDQLTYSISNNVGPSPGTIWVYPEEGRSFVVQFSVKY